MKQVKINLRLTLLIILISTFITFASTPTERYFPQELNEKSWKFSKKDTLFLETLGSTKVYILGTKSAFIEIKLTYLTKADETIEVKEHSEAIYLIEDILNYNGNKPTQLYFQDYTLTITVPQGTYIKCTGSSSSFEINNLKGFFDADYASGEFLINNFNGSINMSLAKLNARIFDSEGSFRLSSAGGSIKASNLTITDNSSFTSGTGSVRISLAQTPLSDLIVGSSSNKAEISYNGHPVTGYFEFIARADKGSIISPYKFDKQENFQDKIKIYRNSSDFGKTCEYDRKSFIRGDGKPKITIKTVTGTARLNK